MPLCPEAISPGIPSQSSSESDYNGNLMKGKRGKIRKRVAIAVAALAVRLGQVSAYWMGSLMSGTPSWASMALSQYSTRE